VRILELAPGPYRSIGFPSLRGGIDASKINVIFGANGAGKSNLLESIYLQFPPDRAIEEMVSEIRPGGTRTDAHIGSLTIQLDRWTEDEAERQALWNLLTDPGMAGCFEWLVPVPLPPALEEAFITYPSPCLETSRLDALIAAWADALADADETAAFEDRRLLAESLLEQGTVADIGGDEHLHFVPRQLSEEARAAAARIAQAPPEHNLDVLFTAATRITADPYSASPIGFLGPPGDHVLARDVRELPDLFGRVIYIEASNDRLLAQLQLALASLPNSLDLGVAVNRLAPGFVRERGEIDMRTTDCVSEVVFRERDGSVWALGDLGAGMRRWIAVAALDAARRAKYPESMTLYLIDEPEAHLHLSAVRSVCDWLAERAQEGGAGAVVATHALELLDLPTSLAEYGLVTRVDGYVSKVTWITETLIESLRQEAQNLGIGRSDWLRVARGVLIVEGAQDEQVIRHYFKDELSRQRIIVLKLYGVDEALALVELEYLSMLGVPLVMLWDSGEKEDKIKQQLRTLGSRVQHVTHGRPDIVCLLPRDAVSEVAGRPFPGWRRLETKWKRTNTRKNFKLLVQDELQMPVDGHFIHQVLSHTDPRRPPADLVRAMNEVLATIDATP
jgi:energy-coupling factor transporter ATP-binding protein EcfA2